MASIHYKFRSLITFKTVNFNSLNVSCAELKRTIFEHEGLNPEIFDMIVENAHSGRAYSEKDMIPRNSSIILKRIPRENASRLPKVQDNSTSGIVHRQGPTSRAPNLGFISTADFSKMTEEQRLDYVRQVSCQKYHPSNYQRKPKNTIVSGTPPPNYICNRCNRSGHWVSNCPLANIKRTTGIPTDELVETTQDDPYAMLHPSGKFMVRKMHVEARRNSKARAPIPFIRDFNEGPATKKMKVAK